MEDVEVCEMPAKLSLKVRKIVKEKAMDRVHRGDYDTYVEFMRSQKPFKVQGEIRKCFL